MKQFNILSLDKLCLRGGSMTRQQIKHFIFSCLMTTCAGFSTTAAYGSALNLSDSPLFVTTNVPPLTMLVMGRDHKLYYEAYNDASDLNGDGIVDVGYQGYHGTDLGVGGAFKNVDYYGYFNSYVCYDYNAGVFEPMSAKSAADIAIKDKTCAGGAAGSWSGDFLNYVTTARIDAMRKVFYGGKRSTDTSSSTVLERTHIPQDAHAWGKEFSNNSGYLISEYTNLSEPAVGTYHLFANVSLSSSTPPYGSNAGTPRLRVLNDTKHRVWEWLSKERPVAGRDCIDGLNGPTVNCSTAASNWSIVPSSAFNNLTRTFYNITGYGGHPSDNTTFIALEKDYAIPGKFFGTNSTDSPSQINGSGNPFGSNDNYMAIFDGNIKVSDTGTYQFAVDGDDAVEVTINDGVTDHVVGWYGGHGRNNSDSNLTSFSMSVYLIADVDYTLKFRMEEASGGDSYYLYWRQPVPASGITDYIVRAEVCTSIDRNVSHETNSCQPYPNGEYKPVGLLHDFGEDDSMMFGLLSGSYENNLDGGVLRKEMSSFKDEVNLTTGQFDTSVNGIVSTLDKLRVMNYDDSNYRYSCGWITNRPIVNGECDMWGNPVAEMMYESLRYFAGKGAATSDFAISATGNNDATLGLPLATWNDPYDATTGFDECAKPFQIVVSDINPSYDSDKVPGAYSDFGSFSGDITGLNAEALADIITDGEGNIRGNSFFVGQSQSNYDNAPTAKVVDSLGSIRGLAPEEPTKLGSYYAASMAYYGLIKDVNPRSGNQNLQTFSVALASPLPTIEIDPDNNILTTNSVVIVPFAKSPGQGSLWANFQPTNQIVDFYVESLGSTSGSFLVNFEDVEQGADHDMDAIARYTYSVELNGDVTIDVDSVYAAGGIDQHMGYIISGTQNRDGVYLEVKDRGGADLVYSLDTPPGVWAGETRGSTLLGFNASRTFTPSGTGASASFLKDPLWYAAKWGGFIEEDKDTFPHKPDKVGEWDGDNDGDPDNYFLVTNALTLKDRMKAAFDEVLARSGSASTVTVSSGSLRSDTLLFQASFNTNNWTGQVKAIEFDGGIGSTVWEFSEKVRDQLNETSGLLKGFDFAREIITANADGKGVPFRFPTNLTSLDLNTDMSLSQVTALLTGISSDRLNYGSDLVNYLRGDNSQEKDVNGATRLFRERQGDGGRKPIGDIVNSDPLYVIPPGFFFPNEWPTTIGGDPATAPENSAPKSYSDFRKTFIDRDPMLFVGANDGMLHAINAYRNTDTITDGGEEILAYVPSVLYNKLPNLANQLYTHEYFVDGKTTYSDVYFKAGTQWHTALVGGLNAGGQAVYALDITDPKGLANGDYPSFDEINADKLVLWEFTDDYPDTDGDGIGEAVDLGYTFGRPTIVRLANGDWGAVFGNGYNNTAADGAPSTTGNSVIYIVNIETGALIKKFDTLQGSAVVTDKPNGMSEVAPVDVNGDFIADYLYAGDLYGNLWKIDISGVNDANWDFSFKQSGNPAPLFVAKSDAGIRLPITQRPIVRAHPKFRGHGDLLVTFGTGKYIETTDNEITGADTQSFFGIWDNGDNAFDRGDLLEQTITEQTVTVKVVKKDSDGNIVIGSDGEPETEDKDANFRTVSNNEIFWEDQKNTAGVVTDAKHGGWVLDLLNSAATTLDNKGERSVTNAVLRGKTLVFTTLIPSSDPCDSGGSSWLMVIDSADGSGPDSAFIDINDDGKFDTSDTIDTDGDGEGDSAVAGLQSQDGILSTSTFLDNTKDGNDSTISINAVSDDSTLITTMKLEGFLHKRLFWRELQ
jgi:type IV pilus assembly protein PilY1